MNKLAFIFVAFAIGCFELPHVGSNGDVNLFRLLGSAAVGQGIRQGVRHDESQQVMSPHVEGSRYNTIDEEGHDRSPPPEWEVNEREDGQGADASQSVAPA